MYLFHEGGTERAGAEKQFESLFPISAVFYVNIFVSDPMDLLAQQYFEPNPKKIL